MAKGIEWWREKAVRRGLKRIVASRKQRFHVDSVIKTVFVFCIKPKMVAFRYAFGN